MMIGARLIPLLFPMLAPEGGGESVDTGFTLLLGDPLAEDAPPAELIPPPEDLPETEGEEDEDEPAELEALPFWWPETKLPEDAPKNVIAEAKDILPTAVVEAKPVPDAPAAPADQTPDAAPKPEKADHAPLPEPAPKVEVTEPALPKATETPQPLQEAREAREVKPAEPPSSDLQAKRAAPPPVAEVQQTPDKPVEKDDLGPIQVMFEREGEATRITLVAERPETLELMRRNAEHLQQELQHEGLGDADLNFAERQRDQPERGHHNAEGADAPIVALPQAGPQSGLDLRL